jgi:hypothetical protein
MLAKRMLYQFSNSTSEEMISNRDTATKKKKKPYNINNTQNTEHVNMIEGRDQYLHKSLINVKMVD